MPPASNHDHANYDLMTLCKLQGIKIKGFKNHIHLIFRTPATVYLLLVTTTFCFFKAYPAILSANPIIVNPPASELYLPLFGYSTTK